MLLFYSTKSLAVIHNPPNLDVPVVRARGQQPLPPRIPRHAVDVLRVRTLARARQLVVVLRMRELLRVLRIVTFPEQSDGVVRARGGDEVVGVLGPVDVVDGAVVVAGEGGHALPHGVDVVGGDDALRVAGLELPPDLEGLVLAHRGEVVALEV